MNRQDKELFLYWLRRHLAENGAGYSEGGLAELCAFYTAAQERTDELIAEEQPGTPEAEEAPRMDQDPDTVEW